MVAQMIKNLLAIQEMQVQCNFPGLGSSPRGRYGNPFQYSCLGNPMNRGVWRVQYMGPQRVGHD